MTITNVAAPNATIEPGEETSGTKTREGSAGSMSIGHHREFEATSKGAHALTSSAASNAAGVGSSVECSVVDVHSSCALAASDD